MRGSRARLKTEANKSQFIRKVSSPAARSHVRDKQENIRHGNVNNVHNVQCTYNIVIYRRIHLTIYKTLNTL